MTPEEKARAQVDAMLTACGWTVQTKDKLNLSASRGVAVCELSFATGEPDYTLFVDGKALGTVEAKPEGHSLIGVVYRIRTDITERGSKVEAGLFVDKRDRLTRKKRWEQLDDDLTYDASQLDRDVVSEGQIRTVLATFRDRLFSEIFPGRTDVPKTLIFAKDDSHADDIVRLCREVFGKGNDFCQKITYRTTGTKPRDLIQQFRNSYFPRIAVTVDMIATGTDVKPLEIVLFMRSVKSLSYFEQMKGRGVRVMTDTEFQAVTPDAKQKTRFVIVDAVGVCERDKSDSRPLERKPHVPFDKLLEAIALGNREPEDLELSPFNQRGGLGKAHQLFGEQLPKLLDELNTVLAA